MENKIEIRTFAKECEKCEFGRVVEREVFINDKTIIHRHFDCNFKEICKYYAERGVVK